MGSQKGSKATEKKSTKAPAKLAAKVSPCSLPVFDTLRAHCIDARPCRRVQSAKFTHPQLVEMGVVTKVNVDAPKALLSKVNYVFTMETPGKFKVEVSLKKGVEINLLSKPVELVLEELLHKQEHNESSLEVEAVQLNVNLLIFLLNKEFMQKIKN